MQLDLVTDKDMVQELLRRSRAKGQSRIILTQPMDNREELGCVCIQGEAIKIARLLAFALAVRSSDPIALHTFSQCFYNYSRMKIDEERS